jgi:hypothetical protein
MAVEPAKQRSTHQLGAEDALQLGQRGGVGEAVQQASNALGAGTYRQHCVVKRMHTTRAADLLLEPGSDCLQESVRKPLRPTADEECGLTFKMVSSRPPGQEYFNVSSSTG